MVTPAQNKQYCGLFLYEKTLKTVIAGHQKFAELAARILAPSRDLDFLQSAETQNIW